MEEISNNVENNDNINSLETLINDEKIISFDPTCIRKKSNWSKSSNIYKFDDENFDSEKLLNDIPEHSPKLDILLKKIEDLDKKDMKKYGKLFKHFIFSDIKYGNYGSRLIASAFIAKGMTLGYNAKLKAGSRNVQKKSESEVKTVREESDSDSNTDSDSDIEQKGGENPEKKQKRYNKLELLNDDELLKKKKDSKMENFYLLSSVSVYDQNITTKDKKEILRRFNQRPENINGELVRFIVMDSGFKEGIDLFDIKYIHIFEPSVVPSDQKQVIGRGTRTCGQKGLEFHPNRGWPLYVYVYDLSIPESLQKSFLGAKSTMELYLKTMNIDIRQYHFAHDLEKTTVLGSVDYDLNKNIHTFAIPNDEDEEEILPPDSEFVYDGGNPSDVMLPIHKIGGGPKRRLNIREDRPKIIIPEPILIETPRMNYEQTRSHIQTNFGEFSWENVKMENLCVDNQKGGRSGEIMNYTPTQDFIRHYFTPMNPQKGLLLWHSTGSGKTCSAIAAATSTFEKQGYTILWVTRTTLKNDIWKNMFDQVCNENISNQIQHSGLKIPDEQSKRMRLLSKSWKIRPMSYKQFSNLVSKQNAFYKSLVKINGEADPLRKTLLIIDEAHKLYGGTDLSTIEKPDMNALHQSLMNSYQISGRDSVKLLLMTATPITQNPMELIQLLNLFRQNGEQLPTDFGDFSNEYLNEIGEFTEEGRYKYLDDIAGYVSYLNREKDARQFAQPQIEQIEVPITNDLENAKRFDKKIVRNLMESDVSDLKKQVQEQSNEIDEELKDLDPNKFMFLKKEICGDLEDKPLKQCEKIVKSNIKKLVQEAKAEVEKIRDVVKQLKTEIKNRNILKKTAYENIKENVENYQDEYQKYKGSVLYSLKKKCAIRITGDEPLKEKIKEHPAILQMDKKINEYNVRIQELQQRLKNDMINYKKRIDYLKGILKEDLSELEKSVIKLTIRDEQKTFRRLDKIKKRETLKAQNAFNKEIKNIEKSRKQKYMKIRKTVKNQIKDEKKNQRQIERAEKKLRKTMRKQGEIQEEINNDLLKNLLNKYRGKITEDLVDLDEKIIQDEQEEEQTRIMKENQKREKQERKEREREEKQRQREIERQEKLRVREQRKIQKEENRKTRKEQKEQKEANRKTKKNQDK